MARKTEETSEPTSAPASHFVMGTAMGHPYKLSGTPQTIEEYEASLGEVGGALKRLINYDKAHVFNDTARGSVIKAIQEKWLSENPEQKDADGNIVSQVLPDQGKLTDTAYFSLLTEGPEAVIPKDYVKGLEIVVDFDVSGTRSSGVPAVIKNLAKASIKKRGSLEAAIANIELLGYTVEEPKNLEAFEAAVAKYHAASNL